VIVTVSHVAQAPVVGKACASRTAAPFTAMFMGRLAVVPLAKRMASVPFPAVGAFTPNST
jgi:hypothetical protein